MSWTPPREKIDPARYYSGDAIYAYLRTATVQQRNALLLSLDVRQLRPYVLTGILQITDGQPRGFYMRVLERLTEVWGTRTKAQELIDVAMENRVIARSTLTRG